MKTRFLTQINFFKSTWKLKFRARHKYTTTICQSNFIPGLWKNPLNKMTALHVRFVIIFNMDMLYCVTALLFWKKNTVRGSLHFHLRLKVEKNSEEKTNEKKMLAYHFMELSLLRNTVMSSLILWTHILYWLQRRKKKWLVLDLKIGKMETKPS